MPALGPRLERKAVLATPAKGAVRLFAVAYALAVSQVVHAEAHALLMDTARPTVASSLLQARQNNDGSGPVSADADVGMNFSPRGRRGHVVEGLQGEYPYFTVTEMLPWLFGAAGTAALFGLLASWLRSRFAAERAHVRLAAQAAERQRISRELHDTLLQSAQGMALCVQAAVDSLDADQEARNALLDALRQADAVADEARRRIAGLRNIADGQSLSALLAKGITLAEGDKLLSVGLVCEGTERAVEAMVMGELQAAMAEALRNIAWHSGATEAKICIAYRTQHLELIVEDNGCGIPFDIAVRGSRDGHFGLVGIAERAACCEGAFRIERRNGGGTRLLITIPAQTAYMSRSRKDRGTLRSKPANDYVLGGPILFAFRKRSPSGVR